MGYVPKPLQLPGIIGRRSVWLDVPLIPGIVRQYYVYITPTALRVYVLPYGFTQIQVTTSHPCPCATAAGSRASGENDEVGRSVESKG